jgi:hypothetical protein
MESNKHGEKWQNLSINYEVKMKNDMVLQKIQFMLQDN